MTTLGDRIKILRVEKGLTIDELGKLSGVSLEIISTLEKGDPLSLTSAALLDIAKALETDPEKLAGKIPAVPFTSSLAQRIKAAREAAGLSQAALSRLAGISNPPVVELESGLNQHPASSLIAGLAKALGVTREWLQHGTGEPPAVCVGKDPEQELEAVVQALDKTNKAILLSIAQTLLSHQKPPEEDLHLERIKGILLAEGIVLDLS